MDDAYVHGCHTPSVKLVANMKQRMQPNKENSDKTEADVLALFTQYLDSLKWKYRPSADRPIVYCGFNGDDAHWDFSVVVRQHCPGVYFAGVNSFIPVKARPERRAAMAELLIRLNFSLMHGCWEMDYQDGDIRFRTSLALPAAEITPNAVEYLIRSNLSIVDENIRRIAAVLYSNTTPDDAMKLGEEQQEAKSEPRFEMN